jgi:hypothetical protein
MIKNLNYKNPKMKKILISSILLFAIVANCFSQDIITKKNGEDFKAKVIEVTPTDISYKKFDAPDGPTYKILKADVLMVRYKDGTKDVFAESQSTSTEDMKVKGRKDANANYKGANSGAGWTMASTIVLSPLVGVIPAAICSSSEPLDNNLKVRNAELMKNDAYSQAYIEQAHKIKKNRIWRSFGVGAGVWTVLIIVLGAL